MKMTRGAVITAVVAAAVLLVAVAGFALLRSDGDEHAGDWKVGWNGSEGHPACVYNPLGNTVTASLTITGKDAMPETVTVIVTAYADENTSDPVGSGTRSVHVEGTVRIPVLVTFQAEQKPYVDIDGVAACSLSVPGAPGGKPAS
jgi:hypothetical protein